MLIEQDFFTESANYSLGKIDKNSKYEAAASKFDTWL